jgi:hypothetical protein
MVRLEWHLNGSPWICCRFDHTSYYASRSIEARHRARAEHLHATSIPRAEDSLPYRSSRVPRWHEPGALPGCAERRCYKLGTDLKSDTVMEGSRVWQCTAEVRVIKHERFYPTESRECYTNVRTNSSTCHSFTTSLVFRASFPTRSHLGFQSPCRSADDDSWGLRPQETPI